MKRFLRASMLKLLGIALGFTFTMTTSFVCQADLVRLTHYPAAMKRAAGIAYDESIGKNVPFSQWKLTTAAPNDSPFASGFVVDVKDGLTFSDGILETSGRKGDPLAFLSFLYPNGMQFKAVYILTNHHVWFNDRAEMQAMAEDFNPNKNLYQMLVATTLYLYNTAAAETYHGLYFNERYPINTWNGRNFPLSASNMGVEVLSSCYDPQANLNSIGRFNYWWGCDFTLVRILVPGFLPITAEKIAQAGPSMGTKLDIWFSPSKTGSYKVVKKFGRRESTFVADIDVRSYAAESGWSGSPVFDRSSREVVGILASGWPEASTMAGAYSIDYVMEKLNVRNSIDQDFGRLQAGWRGQNGPYRGNFYGRWENQLRPAR